MRPSPLLCAAAVTALCAPRLAAQIVRGPFSAFPQAVSLPAPASGPVLPAEQLLIKESGDAVVALAGYPAAVPGKSDFRLESLFPDPAIRNLVDIDGMSTGNDRLIIDTVNPGPPGRIWLLPTAWGAIHFSLRSGAVGDPGSTISTSPNTGAELFGYYLPDSYGIDDALLGNVFVEQTADAMLFQAGQDVDALDLMLPLIVEDDAIGILPNLFGEGFAPYDDQFFFTVTAASAAALSQVPSPFFGSTTLSGATIFRLQWTAASGWGQPTEYRSPASLGLAIDDDVDALAVNLARNTVAFSRRGATSPQLIDGGELHVSYPPSPGTLVNTTLKLPNGGSLRGALGISINDDVDGLCGTDPQDFLLCHMLATPTEVNFAEPMGLSAVRKHRPGLTGRSIVTRLSGWPTAGPQNGFVSYYVWLPELALLLGPVGPLWRTSSQNDYQIEFPLAPDPTLVGLAASLIGYFQDLNGAFAISYAASFRF